MTPLHSHSSSGWRMAFCASLIVLFLLMPSLPLPVPQEHSSAAPAFGERAATLAIAGVVLAVIGIGLAIESLSDDEPEIGDITLTLDDPGDIHVGDQRTVTVEIEASFGYIHGSDEGVIDVEAFLGDESIGSESDSYTKSDLGGHNEGRFTYEFDFEAIDNGTEEIRVNVEVTGDKNHVFWSDDRETVRDDEVRTIYVEFPFEQDGYDRVGRLDPYTLSINHQECPDQDFYLINFSEAEGDIRSTYLADRTLYNKSFQEGSDDGQRCDLVTAPVSHDGSGHPAGEPFYSAWGIDKARILLDSGSGEWEYGGEEHTGPGQNWCSGGAVDCDPAPEDIYEAIRQIIDFFPIGLISYSRELGPAPNVNVRLINNDAAPDTLLTSTDSNGEFAVNQVLGPSVSLQMGFNDPLLVPRYLDSLSVALFDPALQPQISPKVLAAKIPRIAGDVIDQNGTGLGAWIHVLDPDLGEYVQIAYADASFEFTSEDLGFFGYPTASLRFDLDVGRNRHYEQTSVTRDVPTDAGDQEFSVIFTELPYSANPTILFQGQFLAEAIDGIYEPVAGLIIHIESGSEMVTGPEGEFAFDVPAGWQGVSYPNAEALGLRLPMEQPEMVEFGRGGDVLDVGTQILQYAATGVGDFDPQAATHLALMFPNPFRGDGDIRLVLGRAGQLRVAIYNVGGRLVRRLDSSDRQAGQHVLSWDGCDHAGDRLAEGVYLCRAELGSEVVTGKLVLIR